MDEAFDSQVFSHICPLPPPPPQDQYIFCYQVILYVLRCLQAEESISG